MYAVMLSLAALPAATLAVAMEPVALKVLEGERHRQAVMER